MPTLANDLMYLNMERKQKILEFRGRLEKSLESHHLSNEESIKTLVKNQLLRCSMPSEIEGYSENTAEKRAKEVSNFLNMLRSASKVLKTHGSSNGNWKLKEDNEEYRVMYREGAQGTPFHTLLVEGYANATVDVCLCAGWEAVLYKKWYPQITIPRFRVSEAICLEKVRIGEQISLVRMKVPWPLSDREVLVNYFELECFQDGLVLVLLNSVSDMETIAKLTRGFPNEAKDIVQIDLVGGFAIQKVTSKETYFRTLATMDIKLDFVPPSLINFISRQLIGGACKLYQKTVASVEKDDEDFGRALEDPLYVRTREYLYPNSNKSPEPEDLHSDNSILILPKQHAMSNILVNDKTSLSDHLAIETPLADTEGYKSLGEIIEEEIEHDSHIEFIGESMGHSLTSPTAEHIIANKERACMSPEVKGALGILENAISMVQRGGFGNQTYLVSSFTNQDLQGKIATIPKLISLGDGEVCLDGEICLQAPKMGTMCKARDEVDNNNSVHAFRRNKITPPSPEQNSKFFSKNLANMLDSTVNTTTTEAPMVKDYKQVGSKKLMQKKKQRFSCLLFIFG